MRKSVLAFLMFVVTLAARAQLTVQWGTSQPIQAISYNNVSLENLSTYPQDGFSIGHIQSTTTSSSAPTSSGDQGYGGNCSGKSWNASTLTETYTCSWGTIVDVFGVVGNNLTQTVTVANSSGSGEVIDGVDIFPFIFHFPVMPKQYNGTSFSGYAQFVAAEATPPIFVADYGSGIATVVGVTPLASESPSGSSPAIYSGWNLASNSGAYSGGADANGGVVYTPILTTTPPTGAPSFLRPQYARLQPGTSMTYEVDVRFTNEGTQANIADAAANYRSAYPVTLNWADHRPIGSAFLASNNGGGNGNNPVGPTGCGLNSPNKNNWKVGGAVNCSTDPTTPAFQDNILVQAQSNVTNCKAFNCQGVITWDVEGEEFPQDASYVCSPDQVNSLAPEMNLPVNDGNFSQYSGVINPKTGKPWVLIDAYFDIQTSAGIAVGNCLRPDQYKVTTVSNPNDTAQNAFPGDGYDDSSTNSGAVSLLETKISYANSRWGSTLFYTDSMVYADGSVMDENIMQAVTAAYTGVLMIPEAQNGQWHARQLANTAPLYNFEDNGDLGTPYDFPFNAQLVYPKGFGVNLLNESGNVASNITPLTQAAAGGDVMMIHADYNDGNEGNVETIVKNANYQSGGTSPTPNPTASTPGFNPSAGTFTSAQNVAISCSTGTPYYSLTGTATTASTAYSSPVVVSSNTTINAVCGGSSYTTSADVSAAYVVNIPAPVSTGTTWYVRTDGGTRYSANNTNGQCDGKGNAAYPGTGVNQHCAFVNVDYLWDDHYTYGTGTTNGVAGQKWIIAGGDTVILGANTPSTAYRVGWNRNYTNGGYGQGCWGVSNGYCTMPPIPSGTQANPTRILGVNYANANIGNNPDTTKLVYIWGGMGTGSVINLIGSSWVQVEGLNISNFEHCELQGLQPFTNGCNENMSTPSTASDYGTDGIDTSNTSHDLLLQDIYVHGMDSRDIHGELGPSDLTDNGQPFARAASLTANRVWVMYSAQTGWDMDDGTAATPGARLNMRYVNISLSGCQEAWGTTETNYTPASDADLLSNLGSGTCFSQTTGSVADAFGTPGSSGIDLDIQHTQGEYNTQDFVDPGHVDQNGHAIVFRDNLCYGNLGGCVKPGSGFQYVDIEDNLMIANCHRMGYPLAGAPTGYNTNLVDWCRAGSAVSFNFDGSIPNTPTYLYFIHNTLLSYADTVMVLSCDNVPTTGSCTNSKEFLQGNIFYNVEAPFGQDNYNGNDGGPGDFYYQTFSTSTSYNEGTQSQVLGSLVRDHNLWFGIRSDTPASVAQYAGDIDLQACGSIFTNEPTGCNLKSSGTFDETQWDNFNFALQANSPARGAGATVVSGLTTDYVGSTFAAAPSMGALEYGSNAASGLGSTIVRVVVQTVRQGLRGILNCRNCRF